MFSLIELRMKTRMYSQTISKRSSDKDGAIFSSSYPQDVAKLAVSGQIMLTNWRQAVVKSIRSIKISKSINDS